MRSSSAMPIWRVHASSGLLVVPQLVVATFALVYLVDELGWAPTQAGALLAVDINERGGQTLQQKWAEGPKSYLGLMPTGLPNFFTINGRSYPDTGTLTTSGRSKVSPRLAR